MMISGADVIRGLAVVVGALAVLGGLVAVSIGGAPALSGAWAVVFGLVILAAAILERGRYRSAHAEATSERPGPGGGEPPNADLDGRFRRTDERFVDPTSGRTMRVWLDPASGERRYRAED